VPALRSGYARFYTHHNYRIATMVYDPVTGLTLSAALKLVAARAPQRMESDAVAFWDEAVSFACDPATTA
jgi:hypothetical protein